MGVENWDCQEVTSATVTEDITEDLARWLLAAYPMDWRMPAPSDDAAAAGVDVLRPQPEALAAPHVVGRLTQLAAVPLAALAEGRGGQAPAVAPSTLKRPSISKVAVVPLPAKRQRLMRLLALVWLAVPDASVVCLAEFLRYACRRFRRPHTVFDAGAFC